jgi:hypothetical protein
MKNATERQGQNPNENEFDNVLEEILREGRWSGLTNMPPSRTLRFAPVLTHSDNSGYTAHFVCPNPLGFTSSEDVE